MIPKSITKIFVHGIPPFGRQAGLWWVPTSPWPGRAKAISAAAVALLALAAPARAANVVRLHFEAPAACPGALTFALHVQARTRHTRVHPVPTSDRADWWVKIEAAHEGFAGTLTLAQDTRRTERTLAGATCDEVVAGLAVVAALLVEPEAMAPAEEEPAEAAAPAPPPQRAPRVRVSAFAGVRNGAGPGPSLSAGMAFTVPGAPRAAGLVAGALVWRVALQAAPMGDLGVQGLRTAGALTTAWMALCPVALVGPRSHAALCPGVEIGWQRVRIDGGGTVRRHDRPWLAAGAELHLAWRVAHRLVLEANAMAGSPLMRSRYDLQSGGTAYATPAWTATLRLGAGVLLW
jgi:hypothetical protein